MAKKFKLVITPEDQEAINDFECYYEQEEKLFEKARQFSIDDYLILYGDLEGSGRMTLAINAYQAPLKFKVVYVSKSGLPFIKRLNKSGNPIGNIMSCTNSLENDDHTTHYDNFEFALDPDYVDSILLANKYDPTQIHRLRKETWKSVTDHNKASKVKTNTIKDVIDFFNTVTVGDTIWTSNKNYYSIQSKRTVNTTAHNQVVKRKNRFNAHQSVFTLLTVKDKKGAIKDITPNFFHQKVLYKERPRTYKELNI